MGICKNAIDYAMGSILFMSNQLCEMFTSYQMYIFENKVMCPNISFIVDSSGDRLLMQPLMQPLPAER
jgi:hypothetical protein